MKNFPRGSKIFDHTADIGLEIWGDSFDAVFEEAAKALFGLMVDLKQVAPRESVAIELEAETGEELFIKWLKELLFIFDTKHLLLSQFQIEDLTFNRLKARISGEPLNKSKHRLGREVKAVTRHMFEFAKSPSGFRAKIILDI